MYPCSGAPKNPFCTEDLSSLKLPLSHSLARLSFRPYARNHLKPWNLYRFLCFILFAFSSTATHGQFESDPEFLPVDEAYPTQIQLSEDGRVVVSWLMPDGYYLYRHSLNIIGKQGTELGELQIPDGIEKEDEYFGLTEVYYSFLEIAAPVLSQSGEVVVDVHYQGCADAGLCYPPEVREFRLGVGDSASSSLSTFLSSGSEVGFWLAVGSALIAGVLLNLMPCVFPILSIKALSLLQSPDAVNRIAHAFGYLLGVVGTFLVLAVLLLVLRGLGESIGWGFQLQSPAFVATMALLFFVMSLNLLGVIEIPGFGIAMSNPNAPLTGVLAVIVATPCTVPFMAAATGYAISQGGVALVLVMISLGLGMALPYLVITLTPQIAKWLPKPGPWLVTFKQIMAFPLLLSLVWLIWVLARQAGADAIAWSMVGMVALTALAIVGRTHLQRLVAVWCAMLVVIAGTVYAVSSPNQQYDDASSPKFQLAEFKEQVSTNRPLFLNVTADWCITCLVNEQTTLSRARIQDSFREFGIEYVKVDWTNRDAQVTALLQEFGRVGVPLYVYFPRSGEPVLFPQVLTPELVMDQITEITSNSS